MATLKDLTVLGNSRFIGETYGILPDISGNSGKVLAVNSGATGTEWITNSGGGDLTIGGVTIYSGSTAPSSSTGSDGDIYIQTVS